MRSDAMSLINNILEFNVISFFLASPRCEIPVSSQHSESDVASKPSGHSINTQIQTASFQGATATAYVLGSWGLMAGLK